MITITFFLCTIAAVAAKHSMPWITIALWIICTIAIFAYYTVKFRKETSTHPLASQNNSLGDIARAQHRNALVPKLTKLLQMVTCVASAYNIYLFLS